MNESDARQVMLVRALETPPGLDQWHEEDRDWASRLAVAQLGEQASSEQFIAHRAALAVERLSGRLPAIPRLLASVTWRGWILPALLAVAFLAGLMADAVSANRQINILAPPLLALLVWNLAVYVAILANGLFGRRGASAGTGAGTGGKNPAGSADPSNSSNSSAPSDRIIGGRTGRITNSPGRPAGPLTRLLARLAGATAGAAANATAVTATGTAASTASGTGGGAGGRTATGKADAAAAAAGRRRDLAPAPSLGRFIDAWLQASSTLTTARAHACLHYAAAAFAAGALAGLYARGLAFEFLAGWDSTFLDAAGVHRLLQVVLGPASFLTGLPLPDVAHLADLRFSRSAGENAAGWIHLHAVTIGLFVLVPRMLLGAAAQLRAKRLAGNFPIDLDEPYFRHLDRRHRGAAALVQVVPYSFTLPPPGRSALERLLHRTYGENTQILLAEPVRMGDEEDVGQAWRPDPAATLVIVLYAATATPEHENHGAVLDEVRRLGAGAVPVMAMVDEGAFRQRFGADPQRLASRRTAWRRLVENHMDAEPFFVSLDADTGDEMADALEAWIGENAARLGQNDRLTTRDDTAPAGTSA